MTHTILSLSTGPLRIRDCGVSDGALKDLASAMKMNSTLQLLSMRDNDIGDAGCKHIADIIRSNKTLIDISVRNNDLGDLGAEVLCNALQQNTTLKKISLFDNPNISNAKKMVKKAASYSDCLLIFKCPVKY